MGPEANASKTIPPLSFPHFPFPCPVPSPVYQTVREMAVQRTDKDKKSAYEDFSEFLQKVGVLQKPSFSVFP
jgi:hypothetical protein